MMRLKTQSRTVQPDKARSGRAPASPFRLAIISGLILLAGCEAPLDLSGVEQQLKEPVRRTDQILAVATAPGLEVAVGSDGLVLRREGSDTPWQRQILDTRPNLIDVELCPDGSLIALSFERQLWRSDDQAANWQAVDLPTPENLLDLACAPDGSYWAVGSFSTLMSSRDGGASWNENTLGEDAMLSTIQFLDDGSAYVTGEFGILARSDDAGQHWEVLPPIPEDFYPQAARFTSREQGWVAGLDGKVLRTDDAGLTWQTEPTPVVAPLYGLLQSGEALIALGENGTLIRRQQGQWQRLDGPSLPVWLRGAAWQENGHLLIAGGAGTLMSLDIQ